MKAILQGFGATWTGSACGTTGQGDSMWHEGRARFLSRDPASSGKNWYTYCANNPVRSVDSDGLQQHDCWEGTDHIDIAGDTQGIAMLAWVLYPFSENGLSKLEVFNRLIETHGSVRLWGHAKPGNIFIAPGSDDWDILDAKDVRLAAKLRKLAGNGKLKEIYINQCHALKQGPLVAALLELADEVHGYKGWTVDPDEYVPGKEYTWTDPSQIEPDEEDSDKNYMMRLRKFARYGPAVRRLSGGGYSPLRLP